MQAPRLPSVFKHQGTKGFHYIPLYYDADRERREKVRQELERQAQGDKSDTVRRASISFRERPADMDAGSWRDFRRQKVAHSNRTLLIILIALFGLAYYIITW